MSTIKLPDGEYTQTGKETLKELFRVHFPDSKWIYDSDNGQGQQNLGICRCIMNREDWNLAKHVINQSKIRWVLALSNHSNLREQMELYWYFYSKRWNI
jgi:hypothetical protein